MDEMPLEEVKSVWDLTKEQLNDLLVKILVLAAIISFILAVFADEDEYDQQGAFVYAEPVVIILIVVINTIVGIWQQRNAESAISALKEYEPETAKVLRSNRPSIQKIPAKDLVPGDIVEVSTGDKIPADIRIKTIISSSLHIDQSILTGESTSVLKSPEVIPDLHAVTQDMTNILFSGTNVASGKATGIVISTGLSTAIGRIRQEMVSTVTPPTPLQKKLEKLSHQLTIAVVFICLTVLIINMLIFTDPSKPLMKTFVHNLKSSVSLAVAAIPGGLKGVMTVCLALSTRRMASKNAIVRSLPCVENLGYTTVICSDKTGTLTTNQMSACRLLVFGSAQRPLDFYISGRSYSPYGEMYLEGDKIHPYHYPILEEVADISILANDSGIGYNPRKSCYEKIGEATEAALIVLAEKINPYRLSRSGLDPHQAGFVTRFQVESRWSRALTLEFTRDRKSMSTYCIPIRRSYLSLNDHPKAKLFCKGAPESILPRCAFYRAGSDKLPLTPAISNLIETLVENYSTGRDTLRCIALATRDDPPFLTDMDLDDTSNFVKYETNLTFVAVVGMLDPPRLQVASSIAKCKRAGIRVIVLTGDNLSTAEAICRRIGIFSKSGATSGMAFTGREFSGMSDFEQNRCITSARLFARVEPSHKSKIVELLQSRGEVTAMTGDGVNDAPALKKAEIGIAMGSGTAVAKAASDIILADNNFRTIVRAIEEGRAIYSNMRQFIRFLISCNIGEVTSIFCIMVFSLPEALQPSQLLWVNLVTDGFPATALGFNPPEIDVMSRPPRKPSEKLISGWLLLRYLAVGLYVGISTSLAAVWWFTIYQDGPQLTFYQLIHHLECEDENNPQLEGIDCSIFLDPRPMTMALSVLVTSEMFNSLNNISENQSLLVTPPWVNKWLIGAIFMSYLLHFALLYIPILALVFQVTPLTFKEWDIVLKFGVPVILIDETFKMFARQKFSATEVGLLILGWIFVGIALTVELLLVPFSPVAILVVIASYFS